MSPLLSPTEPSLVRVPLSKRNYSSTTAATTINPIPFAPTTLKNSSFLLNLMKTNTKASFKRYKQAEGLNKEQEESRILAEATRILDARKTDTIDYSILRPLSRDVHFMHSLKNYKQFIKEEDKLDLVQTIRQPGIHATKHWQMAKNVVMGTRSLRNSLSYKEVRMFLDNNKFHPRRVHTPLFKSKQVEIGSSLDDKDPLSHVCREAIDLAKQISKYQHYAIRDKGKLGDSKVLVKAPNVKAIIKSSNQTIMLPSLQQGKIQVNDPSPWHSQFKEHHAQLRDSLSMKIEERDRACLVACRDDILSGQVVDLVMKVNDKKQHKSGAFAALPHIWVENAQEEMKVLRKSKPNLAPIENSQTKQKKRGPGIANPSRQADQLLRKLYEKERDEKIAKEEGEYAPVTEISDIPVIRTSGARGVRPNNEIVRFSFDVLGRDRN